MRKRQLLGALILLAFSIALLNAIKFSDFPSGYYKIVASLNIDSHEIRVQLNFELAHEDGYPITNSSTFFKNGVNFTLKIMGLNKYAKVPGHKIWVYLYLYVAGGEMVSLSDIDITLVLPNGQIEPMEASPKGNAIYAYKTIRVNTFKAFLAFVLIVVIWALTATYPMIVALLIPILGILLVDLPAYDVLSVFWDPSVALIFGALILAYAMNKSGLAERITYIILSKAKTPSRVLIYLSLVSFALSMWMSSFGTMIVMLPIIATVLKTMNAKEGSYYARGLTLSTMFATILGGASTIVGNPANALVASLTYRFIGVGIGFLEWIIVATPLTLLILALINVILLRVFSIQKDIARGYIMFDSNAHILFSAHLMGMGPWKVKEKVTFGVLISVVFLWILYSALYVLGITQYMQFAVFSLLAALLLVCTGVLSREDIARVRWDILLVLGGTLSLSVIIYETGLLELILDELRGVNAVRFAVLLIVFIVLLSIILGSLASVAIGIPLLVLLGNNLSETMIIVFALIASTVAVGPNGLILEENVRERGFLAYKDFIKWGFVATIISVLVLSGVFFFLMIYF